MTGNHEVTNYLAPKSGYGTEVIRKTYVREQVNLMSLMSSGEVITFACESKLSLPPGQTVPLSLPIISFTPEFTCQTKELHMIKPQIFHSDTSILMKLCQFTLWWIPR